MSGLSVGLSLKAQIETGFADLRAQSAFFQALEGGKLRPAEVAALLKATHYLITHTPLHLRLAVMQAKLQTAGSVHSRLDAYFHHHLAEEVGHDQWADADLAFLREKHGVRVDPTVVPAMRELVSRIESWIQADVRLYLPYILFAEYLTVVAVPSSARMLVERCGIPAEAISVFTKHSVLDAEHSGEDAEIIDFCAGRDVDYGPQCREVIDTAFAIYREVLEQVLAPAPETRTEVPHDRSSVGLEKYHV